MKKSKTVAIFGATSNIAEAVARIYSKEGASLVLVGRDMEKLEIIMSDLLIRGAKEVKLIINDLSIESQSEKLVDDVWNLFESIDIALIAPGTLPTQNVANKDIAYARKHFRFNSETIIILLSLIAKKFITQKFGNISVISSVAGDRGRKDNFLYGAAKSAVSVFTSGLRGMMQEHGVSVMTIKPGFVKTSMTRDVQFPSLLSATADRVANDIVKSINNGRDVVYTPSFWKIIMIVIKIIPESIFKKINFR